MQDVLPELVWSSGVGGGEAEESHGGRVCGAGAWLDVRRRKGLRCGLGRRAGVGRTDSEHATDWLCPPPPRVCWALSTLECDLIWR